MKIDKPLPLVDQDAEPYWQAAKEHRLALMRCSTCGLYLHPPGPRCHYCGGSQLEWVSLGDKIRGSVYSYVTVYRAVLRSFEEDVPYVVALCDVDGIPGVHIAGNVATDDVNDVHIGCKVTMTWEDRASGCSLPQWKLQTGMAPTSTGIAGREAPDKLL